jgi:hypothetical protein
MSKHMPTSENFGTPEKPMHLNGAANHINGGQHV